MLSRSQPGVAVAMNNLTTGMAPKTVIIAHARPAGPLSPSASDSAAVDPINDVRAAISIRLLPKLKVERPLFSALTSVELAMESFSILLFLAILGQLVGVEE